LDAGAQRVNTDLAASPLVRARVMAQIGRAYRLLGAYPQAQPLLESAVDYYEHAPGASLGDRVAATTELGNLYAALKRDDDALRTLKKAVSLEAEDTSGAQAVTALMAYAFAAMQRGNNEDALHALDTAASILRKRAAPGRDDLSLAIRYEDAYRHLGDYKRAERYGLQALALLGQLNETASADATVVLANLSLLYQEMDDLKNAKKYAEQEVQLTEQIFGPQHPSLATSLQNYAIVLAMSGDRVHAEPLFRRTLEIRLKAFGPDSVLTAYAYDNLAEFLVDGGQLQAALQMVRQSQAIYEHVEGPTHNDVAYALKIQAAILTKLHRTREARPLATRALAINEAAFGKMHPEVARALLHLAKINIVDHDYQEAAIELERAIKITDSVYGPQSARLEDLLVSDVEALRGAGRRRDADAAKQRLEQLRESERKQAK
jgi:tetratricopeptide (TPR) repeat protein